MNTKKIIQICICFLLSFTLVGCLHTKEDVTAVVDDYYQLLGAGDIEKANKKYATKSFGFNSESLDAFQEKMKDIDMSEQVDLFTKHVVSRIYEKYEIVSVDAWGADATVKVDVTGILPENLNDLDALASEKMEALLDAYIQDHQAQLTPLIMKDEEKATQKIFEDLSQPIFDMYIQLIDEMEVHTSTLELKLKKNENGWKIVQLN